MRQVDAGKVKLHTRSEMLDVVVKDGRAVGIVTRDLVTGEIESHSAHAVVLATGGYSNVYYLSTNAMAATSPPPGGPTARERPSPTPATPRSTPPASPPPTSSSRS
jgi:predicted flavoprotein YhiN